MTPKEMAFEVVKILDAKKAKDIQVLDVQTLSTLGDYFVIASGNNLPHVKSLIEDIEDTLSSYGIEPRNVEGKQSAAWVLMDYLDIVVHVFDQESREFYQLERLWGDAPLLDLSTIIAD